MMVFWCKANVQLFPRMWISVGVNVFACIRVFVLWALFGHARTDFFQAVGCPPPPVEGARRWPSHAPPPTPSAAGAGNWTQVLDARVACPWVLDASGPVILRIIPRYIFFALHLVDILFVCFSLLVPLSAYCFSWLFGFISRHSSLLENSILIKNNHDYTLAETEIIDPKNERAKAAMDFT